MIRNGHVAGNPDLKPEQIGPILEPFIEDPLCLGIGEIGLL